MPETAAGIRVSSAERDVAVDEVRAVLASARDEGYREQLEHLLEALDSGVVDDELADALDRIVSLGLQSGRIRHVYGPGGEQAALRLYRKLPSGRAVQASADEVAAALSSLAGRRLDSVAIQPAGPGAFTITLAADGINLAVRLDRQGARLHSVEA
jgi:hypothetical protein